MVLYSKRTYVYQFSEDTGPIKFRSLVLDILQKPFVFFSSKFELLILCFMRVPFTRAGSIH